MFRSYAFTEMPYPYMPPDEVIPAARTIVGNEWFDPDSGYDLFRKYIDIYVAADELGLDVMLNEHHQSPTCLSATVPLHLATLARLTTNARLLSLGNPVANRGNPVRLAEELATIDILSRGRVEAGFVRGSPYEVHATNTNPVTQRDRFWEGVDLITKAWTTHDGPFNWEGEHFQHRQVNIWPRPYQQPHPRIWVTTLSPSSTFELAKRDYVVATIMNGKAACAEIFDSYRKGCADLGQDCTRDKLAYTAFMFVGADDDEGFREAKKLQWFTASQQHVPPQFTDVAGYLPASLRAGWLQTRLAGGESKTNVVGLDAQALATGPIRPLADDGIFFCGSPDTVFHQMKDFYEAVGGFGHLIMMVQSSTMGFDLVCESMRRYTEQVLPRFVEEVYDRDRSDRS